MQKISSFVTPASHKLLETIVQSNAQHYGSCVNTINSTYKNTAVCYIILKKGRGKKLYYEAFKITESLKDCSSFCQGNVKINLETATCVALKT